MPMFESFVAMTTSQQPRMAALPAKQYPALTPTSGTSPRQLGEVQERHRLQPRCADAVGVAGAPATALREEHDRQPQPLGQLEQAVLLAVVLHALGTGEDGVVVGDGDRPRRLGPELVAVDRADAPDETVGRRVGDEVVEAAAAALAGDHDRPVLHEGALVDEVGDVLAGRAAMAGPALGHGVRASLVAPDAVPLERLGQVGPQPGRCHRVGSADNDVIVSGNSTAGTRGDGLEAHEEVARHHGRADGDRDLGDLAGGVGGHVVVHLHRLDERQDGARPHDVADGDLQRHDRALQRAADLLHVSSSADRPRWWPLWRGAIQPVGQVRRAGRRGSTRRCGSGPRGAGSPAPSRGACGPG